MRGRAFIIVDFFSVKLYNCNNYVRAFAGAPRL